MAEENITFGLTVEGAERAAQQLGQVSTATDGVDRSTKRAAGSLADAGVKWNTFGSTLGMIGRGIGQTDQTLGRMVMTLGTAVGTIGTLTATMGPLGAVIGVASTAFTLYEQSVSGAKRETDQLNVSTQTLVERLTEIGNKLRNVRESAELADLLRRGLGTREQHESRAVQLRQDLAQAQARLREGGVNRAWWASGGESARAAEHQQWLASREGRQAQEEIRRLEQRIAGQEGFTREAWEPGAPAGPQDPGIGRRSARGGGGGRRAPGTPGRGGVFDFTPTADWSGEFTGRAERDAQREADKERDSLAGHADYLAERQRMDEDANRERMRIVDEYAEYERGVQQDQMEMYQTVSGIAVESLQGILSSDRKHLSETLKNMGINYGWKAAGELAAALGTQFIPGFQAQAAGHWASFGVYSAAAVALGAGSAATAGGGGRGGGGGGNARPERAGSAASGDGGATTIVVNLPATSILAGTYADAGVQIARAARAATRTYGVSA